MYLNLELEHSTIESKYMKLCTSQKINKTGLTFQNIKLETETQLLHCKVQVVCVQHQMNKAIKNIQPVLLTQLLNMKAKTKIL